MKIACKRCGQMIDQDSVFCKYCGDKTDFQVTPIDLPTKQLKDIFECIQRSLLQNSSYSQEAFDSKFNRFKTYENRVLNDNEYFRILVDVIFYSGFRASTVSKYLETIHQHFPDIQTVRAYSSDKIGNICHDPKMIKNRAKIEAVCHNAKTFEKLIKKHGSFKNFVRSFGDMSDDKNLFKFKDALQKNFAFLGGITVYHFMMDIGLNVLKPDRVMMRIFSRLGLISNEKDFKGAVLMGRAFSKATGLPIRYIDVIFVMYGQLNQEMITSICTEENPKCHLCGASGFCDFFSKRH